MDVELISVDRIWVNRAYIGMDECGIDANDAVGTLIYTMSHGCVVRVSDDAVRRATIDEIATWTGPISPAWAESRKSPELKPV